LPRREGSARREVEAPLGAFYAQITDEAERVISWRRTTAEQALHYRDHQREFVDRYAGQFILLQDGEVRWHDTQSHFRGSRRDLSGDKPDQALWLKYVDPEEVEGERFEVYERVLKEVEQLDKA
jgi:hypothetical protein